MTTQLDNYLQKLQTNNEKTLIPFMVAGYPDLEESVKLAVDILDAGGDVLELGLPFSEPMADGPIIEEASHYAVHQGIKTAHVLEIVKRVTEQRDKPVVLLTYYNPILKYGIKNFVRDFANAGLSGLVIPDLPAEEREELYSETKGKMALIPLVSPATENERMNKILHNSEGFVYCISRLGTTGEREELSSQGEELIERTGKFTDLPLMLGFGIKSPEQAKLAASYASGVIVGSAVMKQIVGTQEANESHNTRRANTCKLVASLKSAISPNHSEIESTIE